MTLHKEDEVVFEYKSTTNHGDGYKSHYLVSTDKKTLVERFYDRRDRLIFEKYSDLLLNL